LLTADRKDISELWLGNVVKCGESAGLDIRTPLEMEHLRKTGVVQLVEGAGLWYLQSQLCTYSIIQHCTKTTILCGKTRMKSFVEK
jgi:hypothetical protein